MRILAAALLVSVALLTVGCAAKPQAELSYIDDPSDLNGREIDTYAFPRTYVDLPAPDEQGKVDANVRQVAFEGFRIAVRPKSSLGVRTRVSMSKKDNSDLLHQAGVEVIDDRAKLLGEVGGIIKGIISLGAGASLLAETEITTDKLPMTIDTLPLLPSGRQGTSADPGRGAWSVDQQFLQYWFGPVAPDARLVTPGAVAATGNGLIYAACRELRLRFAIPVGQREVRYNYNLFVSDPRYYRFAAFPAKGNILVHDRCGVSVTNDKPEGVSSDTAVLLSLINQMNEIKGKLDDLEQE